MNGAFRAWLPRLHATVRLGRPKFLLGGVALFALGTLTAERFSGAFEPSTYLWGQWAVLCIQLMTHYSNDHFDYDADVENRHPTPWSGGSRVLVNGELERSVALKAAVLFAALAVGCLVRLLVVRPEAWLGVALLGGLLLLSWSYSSPPLTLHRKGLGEPTVWLVVPVGTPLSAFALQTGSLSAFPFLVVLPSSLFLLSMLLTFELPDERGDRRVGKRTWTVNFGPKRVAIGCAALTVLAFAARFVSVRFGLPTPLGLGWLWLLPLAVLQVHRLLAGDWKRPRAWASLAFGAAALFLLSVVLDLVSLYRLPSSEP